jgi:cellulose synthase/poly-beta-1,6-N-acetylglucosamine synthase-like glycosyltransferase
MRALFWISAAVVAYVYAGYPLLLAAWARMTPRREVRRQTLPGQGSGVSIVIAARDEAGRLPARIRNLLSIDYPPGRRQIIVVSDGSTDNTEAALVPFTPEVEVVTVPAGGKASALNAGVARARFDVLVFADARQTFAPDTLTALVAPFADSRIGCVTGELILGCESGGRRLLADRRADAAPVAGGPERRSAAERRGHLSSTAGDAVGLYWRYEKTLRRLESRVHSPLGATGAVYALRRNLWRPLPAGTLLDDVLAPMRGVLAGFRIVFEPAARAFDTTPPDAAAEGRRKLRTLAGNFQILRLEPRLLVPFVNPVWVQYVSHKVGRLVVPYALVSLFAASLALAGTHLFYAVALGAQCAAYLLGGYGAWLEFEAGTAPWAVVPKGSPAAHA